MRARFYISEVQMELAVAMWRGGSDTLDIAKALHVPESEIHNRLPKWRATIPAQTEMRAA